MCLSEHSDADTIAVAAPDTDADDTAAYIWEDTDAVTDVAAEADADAATTMIDFLTTTIGMLMLKLMLMVKLMLML